MSLDPVIETMLRTSLALLFASAALHKLREPAPFARTLADYRVLPEPSVPIAAAALVIAELGLAIALLLPAARTPALLAALGLLSLYSAAIALNLARGRRHIDCGCAGPAARQSLSGGLVLRNAILIAAAGACLLPLRPRSLLWLDLATIAAAVVALSALYGAANRLLAGWPELSRLRRTA